MRIATLLRLVLIGSCAAAPTLLLAAQPWQGNGKPDKSKGQSNQKSEEAGHADVDILITAGIQLSREDARRYALDSDLTGLKPLPPGIRKNLARGKPMPPGIAKTRLPDSFVRRLPVAEGYTWRIAGVDLVLVARTTDLISGVLRNVFD